MRHARIVLAFVALAVVADACGGGGGGGGGGGPHLVAVSVGNLHACALDASGTAYCWGANTNGELGNGTFVDSNRPVPVSGGIHFSQISAGNAHSCGVSTAGQLYCWGLEDYGEVGNVQETGNDPTPTAVATDISNITPFVAVSAGGDYNCAVGKTGSTFCWGASWLGELGLGQPIGLYGGIPSDPNEAVVSPTPISVLVNALVATPTSLSAGRQHTCGIVKDLLAADNPVFCWGDNLDSEVSTNASDTCGTTSGNPATFPCSVSPVQVGTYKATAVTSGGDFSCGLTMAHAVSCWGSDEVGQLGSPANTAAPCPYLPHITMYCDANPTPVDPGLQFSEVSAGFEFACGVTIPQEAALCWGVNDHGQLGTGQDLTGQPCYSNSAVVPPCAAQPVAVNLDSSILQISAGGNSACMVTSANAVYCWGDDSRGQLGNGTTGGESTNPVQIVS
jgi:alpha-tubulin suppressor-like RCC1 family protein